jgi:NADPH:quinone reductase-like Zn-dependent oxidoreductase
LGLTKLRNAVLGGELAGEIEAVGGAVTRFKKGDQVFAFTGLGFGAHAEYKCLTEDGAVALKPCNCTCEQAAAIPIGGRTALHFLRKANIRRGQKILVYGASGSVGTYAVQLAKSFGAEVTGVCSTSNIELVRRLGADRVIDYTHEDFSTTGDRYDIICEAVGKSSFSACMKVLKDDGVYLAVSVPVLTPRMILTTLMGRRKIINTPPAEKTASTDLLFLKERVEAGDIKPVIVQEFPFDHIAEAHRYVDKGHKKGNIVIKIC